jgi:hypothetical protein
MQLIVAGVDSDNRSGVVERSTLPQDQSVALWKTTDHPPKVVRPTTVPPKAAGCPPGLTAWGLNHIPPNTVREMHRTDLLSYNVVLVGSVDLILETERVRLDVGDCLVLLGAMHGWETHSEGSTFAYTAIGLEPSAKQVSAEREEV